MMLFEMKLALFFFLLHSTTASLRSVQPNNWLREMCGKKGYEDSWIVEIQPAESPQTLASTQQNNNDKEAIELPSSSSSSSSSQRRRGPLCFAVLIDDQHLVTSKVGGCEKEQLQGRDLAAAFPSLEDYDPVPLSREVKAIDDSALVFRLERPVELGARIRPVCVDETIFEEDFSDVNKTKKGAKLCSSQSQEDEALCLQWPSEVDCMQYNERNGLPLFLLGRDDLFHLFAVPAAEASVECVQEIGSEAWRQRENAYIKLTEKSLASYLALIQKETISSDSSAAVAAPNAPDSDNEGDAVVVFGGGEQPKDDEELEAEAETLCAWNIRDCQGNLRCEKKKQKKEGEEEVKDNEEGERQGKRVSFPEFRSTENCLPGESDCGPNRTAAFCPILDCEGKKQISTMVLADVEKKCESNSVITVLTSTTASFSVQTAKVTMSTSSEEENEERRGSFTNGGQTQKQEAAVTVSASGKQPNEGDGGFQFPDSDVEDEADYNSAQDPSISAQVRTETDERDEEEQEEQRDGPNLALRDDLLLDSRCEDLLRRYVRDQGTDERDNEDGLATTMRCLPIPAGICLSDDPDQDTGKQLSCRCDVGHELRKTDEGDFECVQEEQEALMGGCSAISGESCIFPFKFQGEQRFECVKRNGLRRASCPTTIAKNGKMSWKECSETCPLMRYHQTHASLVRELKQLARAFPNDAKTFSLGRSVRNHELLGIRISRNLKSRKGLERRPRVKLVGNMHGNEPVGRELLIRTATRILTADEREDNEAKRILDNTDLWILPTMNPDGFARATEGQCEGGDYAAGRVNEGRKDLNRDFPDFEEWRKWRRNSGFDLNKNRQKETKLLMRWIMSHNFVLSANFHDGAVLVNYPWDNYHRTGRRRGVHKTPDHPEFIQISRAYAHNHPNMNDTKKACDRWPSFREGLTNGADWYPVVGGMQDFNYLFADTMEVTVEVSCCKYPEKEALLDEWNLHKDGIIAYVLEAQRGIRGRVIDGRSRKPVVGAKIRVRLAGVRQDKWRSTTTKTNFRGIFWRILVPGEYEVQAVVNDDGKEKAISAVKRVTVKDEEKPTDVDFVLNAAAVRNNDEENNGSFTLKPSSS